MSEEPAMIGSLKKCCPTADDNNYHLRGFHTETHLVFEDSNTKCIICKCCHPIVRCPFIHPLNREKSNFLKEKGMTGGKCHWCKGPHIGLDCPDRQRIRQSLINKISGNL